MANINDILGIAEGKMKAVKKDVSETLSALMAEITDDDNVTEMPPIEGSVDFEQVSFSYDYNNGMKGYASPMMWGQYAWRKNKVGSWQNGVCLAIDSEKIKEPAFKIYSNKIFYNSVIDTPRVENIDYTKEGAAALFVARNIHAYFFTKHKHWEHENEYRYICKHEVELDISEAIISIYTLWDDYTPLEDIKSIVNNNSLINSLL